MKNTNLDVKILFGKITQLLDPWIRNMLERGVGREREFHVKF